MSKNSLNIDPDAKVVHLGFGDPNQWGEFFNDVTESECMVLNGPSGYADTLKLTLTMPHVLIAEGKGWKMMAFYCPEG